MSSENKPLISFHLEKAIAFGKKTSPTTQCWFYTLICRPISVWCSNIEFSFRGINPRDLLLGWGCSIPSQQIHFLYPAREQSSFSNKKWFLNISASDGWDFLKVEFLQFSTVQFLPPPPTPCSLGNFWALWSPVFFNFLPFPPPLSFHCSFSVSGTGSRAYWPLLERSQCQKVVLSERFQAQKFLPDFAFQITVSINKLWKFFPSSLIAV